MQKLGSQKKINIFGTSASMKGAFIALENVVYIHPTLREPSAVTAALELVSPWIYVSCVHGLYCMFTAQV